MAALVGVVVVGSVLQARGLTGGGEGVLTGIGIEIVRFSPLIVYLAIVRPRPERVWAPVRHWPWRLGVGVLAGVAALVVYAFASRIGVSLPGDIASGLSERGPRLAPAVLHIFFEDLAIAATGAMLVAVCRNVWLAGVIVASLFALAHVPGMVQDGFTLINAASLALDTALGVGVFLVLARTRDFLWFWPLHVAMDLTQFTS
jgi:hypothetical protein